MERQRLDWVDRMRGIAMLMVVMQHISAFWRNSFVYERFLSMVDIGLFFFVSGYILNETTKFKSLKDDIVFLRKRTFHLMIPFFIWGVIAHHCFFVERPSIISLNDIVSQWENPTLWFLLTLYGYMYYFVGHKIVDNRCGSGILTNTFSVLFYLFIIALWKITGQLKDATLYFPTFALGVLTSSCKSLRFFDNKHTIGVSILMIMFLTAFWQQGSQSMLFVGIKYVITLAAISIIYVLSTQFKWYAVADYFIQSCGKYSIAIYCMHWPFTYVLDKPSSVPFLINNELYGLSISFSLAVIISLICISIKKVIMKCPWLDFVLFGNTKQL